jgi:hypothetical protein
MASKHYLIGNVAQDEYADGVQTFAVKNVPNWHRDKYAAVGCGVGRCGLVELRREELGKDGYA